MRNILYILALVLVIGWAAGFFAFQAGSVIHILLAIAVIILIFQLARSGKAV